MLNHEEKLLQLQKENKERIKKNEKKQQLQKENEERILKNEEKQQQFFLELQKRQEALFKSLSNNNPTDNTTIFTQNAVWNAVETFSCAPNEDKTFEVYYRRYLYYRLCRLDWCIKCPAASMKARNREIQQVRRLYLIKKKKKNNLRTWLFRNS